ncbi:hypothetical protein ABZZ17_22465 [Streptomyces sp. NPDC006512]|uniref:hypothetical protein n=1 Tax=Streptomyces sp. NPDC006512 TaxID=3154307 RepID=UPI0033B6E6A5
MFHTTARTAAATLMTLTLAAFTVSCGGGDDPKASAPAPASASASPSAAASPTASPTPSASVAGSGGSTVAPDASPSFSAGSPSPRGSEEPVSLVRDAFAGLQATLNDSCTPGNCSYFLGRVYDELHRMDRAMKADAKGPGHFPEPISLIAKLDKQLGGDRSFENLKKNQKTLIDTRDKINVWMQGHPDDYR